MDAYPVDGCPGGEAQMKSLIGLRIGRGWNSEVNRRIGGAPRLHAFRELLGPIATTAMQALGARCGCAIPAQTRV